MSIEALFVFKCDTLYAVYYVEASMTRIRKVTTFRVDPDVQRAMEALRERDGISLSEQIRRALRSWLEAKGTLRRANRAAARPSTRAALRVRR